MANLSNKQFIDTLAPIVVRTRLEGSPLFPSVRLAQSLLETGGVIHPWNNLGGYKVGSGQTTPYWHGQWVRKGTWEVESSKRTNSSALFRAYDSVYDFYKDQDLLFQIPRYERVRSAATPEQQAEALQLCGYATDPRYGSQIISLIQEYNLTQYDEEAVRAQKGLIPITINGVKAAEGELIEGQTWVPARLVGERLGISIGWNGKAVTANGQVLSTQLKGSTGYVPIRELAATADNIKVAWVKESNSVEITATEAPAP